MEGRERKGKAGVLYVLAVKKKNKNKKKNKRSFPHKNYLDIIEGSKESADKLTGIVKDRGGQIEEIVPLNFNRKQN